MPDRRLSETCAHATRGAEREKTMFHRSRRGWLVHHLLAAIALTAGTAAPAQTSTPGKPQAGLPVVELTAGMHRIRAELAATPVSRSTGLMHRRSLGPNQGMLFVFPERGVHCFCMRNTLIPLTIAFVADDGRIVNTADMAPLTESGHCPAEPVRLALEMEQGWFVKKGIRTGDRIGIPRVNGR
jgi:uncharacterized membrane protein (UPF0127 family)